MPFIHHGRYRGGNQFQRFSAVDVQAYTDANHSRYFNGRLAESQAALARNNAPKSSVSAPAVEACSQDALRAKLLGLSSATLAKLLRRFGVEGRSKLRSKVQRVNGLLGPVERLTPAQMEALFA